MQTSSVGRPRKYSDVAEEDEATGGSGSESSRRSQRYNSNNIPFSLFLLSSINKNKNKPSFLRSSSNSLTSQRTSNTSLASQRASNNSLAGSLRARGLLTNVSTIQSVNKGAARSSELRLDFADKITPQVPVSKLAATSTKPLETQKSIDQYMEVPAPFPTTSNIGLGLRSPRTSPLTSPVTCQRAGILASGRATPASISPTSPSTTLSSPGSSPNVMSPTVNSKTRSTLPSPNRVLHSVRSSPQLILNEIFEEAESCSDSESTSRGEPTVTSAKSPGLRIRTTINGHRHRPSQSGRATSAGPSARSSTSPPSLVRRYEQRRQLAKARTASCSSSDASDDDNEGRKKRAEKIKSLPPRRDSHDDSSDPGCDGPGGGNDGAGISGGNAVFIVVVAFEWLHKFLCLFLGGGASSMDSYNRAGSSSQAPKGSDSGHHSGGSSGGRRHLQTTDAVDQRNPRSRYRIVGSSHGRRYTNASFSLLSPHGLGSETHLRVSQSLTCLTEVCETPESPRSTTNMLEIPPSPSTMARIPAKSCGNLEKIEEIASLDGSPEMVLVLPPSPLPASQPSSEKGSRETVMIQDDVVMDTEPEPPLTGCSCSCTTPTGGKKHKRLRQLFSRREGTNSSFKVNRCMYYSEIHSNNSLI